MTLKKTESIYEPNTGHLIGSLKKYKLKLFYLNLSE
jgi:hypothetical protein